MQIQNLKPKLLATMESALWYILSTSRVLFFDWLIKNILPKHFHCPFLSLYVRMDTLSCPTKKNLKPKILAKWKAPGDIFCQHLVFSVLIGWLRIDSQNIFTTPFLSLDVSMDTLSCPNGVASHRLANRRRLIWSCVWVTKRWKSCEGACELELKHTESKASQVRAGPGQTKLQVICATLRLVRLGKLGVQTMVHEQPIRRRVGVNSY